MEIRARFVLVGVFVVAVIVAAFGFIYWLSNSGGIASRTTYRVEFDSSVSGLWAGSTVLFNGLTVGEVSQLDIVPNEPNKVMATIVVDSRTPVRADTRVGLVFSGLTGTASIALSGGTASAPAPAAQGGTPPLLTADTNATKDLTQSARDTLSHVDQLIGDNSATITDAITNIDTFAAALGKNSDKVGDVLGGLAKLAGGGKDSSQVSYQLSPPAAPSGTTPPDAVLAIADPTAVLAVDAQTITMEAQGGGLVAASSSAKWADNLPSLVRDALISGFRNANYMKVGADGGDLSADYKLALDVQRFSFAASGSPDNANVVIAAQLLDSSGKLIDSRVFSGSAPVTDPADIAGAVAAMDAAFGKAGGDLIGWAMTALAKAGAPSP